MTESDEKPWHRQFWPWFLIALPSVVIIACLYTVYLALDNPLSMVNKDYYQEGLTINKNIAELKRAEILKLTANIRLSSVDNESANFFTAELLSLQDIAIPLSLELQFHHPVNDEKDIKILLNHQKEKIYVSPALTRKEFDTLNQEKNWYVNLLTITTGEPGWNLEGRVDRIQIADFVLGSRSD